MKYALFRLWIGVWFFCTVSFSSVPALAASPTITGALVAMQKECAFLLGQQRPHLLEFTDRHQYYASLEVIKRVGGLVSAVEPFFIELAPLAEIDETVIKQLSVPSSDHWKEREYFRRLIKLHNYYPHTENDYYDILEEELLIDAILDSPPVTLLETMVKAIVQSPANPRWMIDSLVNSIASHQGQLASQHLPQSLKRKFQRFLLARALEYAEKNKMIPQAAEFTEAVNLLVRFMDHPAELSQLNQFLDDSFAPVTHKMASEAILSGLLFKFPGMVSQEQRMSLAQILQRRFHALVDRLSAVGSEKDYLTGFALESVFVTYASLGLPDFSELAATFIEVIKKHPLSCVTKDVIRGLKTLQTYGSRLPGVEQVQIARAIVFLESAQR